MEITAFLRTVIVILSLHSMKDSPATVLLFPLMLISIDKGVLVTDKQKLPVNLRFRSFRVVRRDCIFAFSMNQVSHDFSCTDAIYPTCSEVGCETFDP